MGSGQNKFGGAMPGQIGLGMGGARPDGPPGIDPAQMDKLLEMMEVAKAAKSAEAQRNHEPVLKSLEKLGVKLRTETHSGATVVLINLEELLQKEYAYITGIDVASMREMATTGRLDMDLAINNQDKESDDGTTTN